MICYNFFRIGSDIVEALDNKCPSCNSQIVFNPVNQTWDCTYCGGRFSLEQLNNYDNNVSNSSENLDSYKCKNCGAEIMALENTVATFCVYCKNTAILKGRLTDKFEPSKVIPFFKTFHQA